MIGLLSQSLKGFIEAAPGLPADLEVSLQRPSDAFRPDKTALNLFLFDLREHAELRDNQPQATRGADGTLATRQPPLRLACSYLVTAWAESSTTADDAALLEQNLLGDLLALLAATPVLPTAHLQGALSAQPWPLPLDIGRAEALRQPAEFWSALGGKLRPAVVLTATLAIERAAAALRAPAVATHTLAIAGLGPGAASQSGHRIGGTVRSASGGAPLAGVALTLPALGVGSFSDADGRWTLALAGAGRHRLQASKAGFASRTVEVDVPGGAPTAFDLTLNPAP